MKIELYDNLMADDDDDREVYVFINGRELDVEDMILEIKSRYKLDFDYEIIELDRVAELLKEV